MNTKKIWLSWLYLYILCAVLGFIPAPTGVMKAILIVLGIGFFVPPIMLIRWAEVRDNFTTLRRVRLISAIALPVSVGLVMLNMASALMSRVAGDVLYAVLVIVASPLVCGQVWVLTFFGWAYVLIRSAVALKKIS